MLKNRCWWWNFWPLTGEFSRYGFVKLWKKAQKLDILKVFFCILRFLFIQESNFMFWVCLFCTDFFGRNPDALQNLIWRILQNDALSTEYLKSQKQIIKNIKRLPFSQRLFRIMLKDWLGWMLALSRIFRHFLITSKILISAIILC